MKRKKGFTLSEVMVAMSLVGIVAALTIPTFIANGRNRANATKLSTVVSAVENAFTSMLASEGYPDIAETAWGINPTAGNLGVYLKLSGSKAALSDYYGTSTPFLTLNQVGENPDKTDLVCETKNGAYLIYQKNAISRKLADVQSIGGAVADSIGRLIIDVNGKSKPNVWGRDVFYFRIGEKGLLYPAGSKNFSILEKNTNTHTWDSAESDYACNGTTKNSGCSARLIENGYEIDF